MLYLLRCAAEQFGDKDPSEIEHIIKETLEGHQREIMAHMTVEEIYRKVLNPFLLKYMRDNKKQILVTI